MWRKTFLHTLCPTMCFHITHNCLFSILHPTVCVWMDKLDFMVEIFFFLHLYALKVSHVCDFSYVPLAEIFS